MTLSFVVFFQSDQICYAVLCVFSYVATGVEQRKRKEAAAGYERLSHTEGNTPTRSNKRWHSLYLWTIDNWSILSQSCRVCDDHVCAVFTDFRDKDTSGQGCLSSLQRDDTLSSGKCNIKWTYNAKHLRDKNWHNTLWLFCFLRLDKKKCGFPLFEIILT